MHPKVVIVGAGSLFFGRKAIWQMVHSEALREGTLALVDTDADRLERMKTLAEKVIAHNDVPLKLEASTDVKQVLDGADFVVLCFAHRNAHYRGVDCELSEKYGIRMCSGDTIGPGGIFRTARELPQILDTCRDIERLCPDAWVINYINPTAVCGIAVKRNFPGTQKPRALRRPVQAAEPLRPDRRRARGREARGAIGGAQPLQLAAAGRVRRPGPDPADRRPRPPTRRGRRQPPVPGRLEPGQGLPQQHHRDRALRSVRRAADRARPHEGIRPLLPGPRQGRPRRRSTP